MSAMSDKRKIVIPTEEEMAEYTQGATQGGSSASGEESAVDAGSVDGAAPASEQGPAGGDDYKDKYLRAVAELANFRKRAEKDREESLRYATTGLVRSLLPVLDNLDRVVASANEHPENTAAIVDGVKLTIGSFKKALSEHHVVSIDAQNQPFDPAVHEAMMQQPSDQYDTPTVLQVFQEGFKLFDRVIRPARVIVSKPAESE
jgi:molecular chaperone GrpE